MVITINRSHASRPSATHTPSSPDDGPSPDDSASFEGSDEEVDDAQSSEEEWDKQGAQRTPPRKSGRLAQKVVKQLPFSPQKTRSRKRSNRDDDDSEDEDGETANLKNTTSLTSLRSNPRRTRNASTCTMADEDYVVSDEEHQIKRNQKRKGKQRPRPITDSSGLVRHVDDLDYDSDEETAPLRAHRHLCERCVGGPSHLQKKAKKPRKRKSAQEDDFEDEADLAGWLTWRVDLATGHQSLDDHRPARVAPSPCIGGACPQLNRMKSFVAFMKRI
jgi:chromodomain-helicase-DNA-binding protein 4